MSSNSRHGQLDPTDADLSAARDRPAPFLPHPLLSHWVPDQGRDRVSAILLSLVGSIWLIDLLDYNWSVAVVVSVIALAGLATENGVVELLGRIAADGASGREAGMSKRSRPCCPS